jgi:hypothetical protein
MIALQYHGAIYYRVYKDVAPGKELLVWYGEEYAIELGIALEGGNGSGEDTEDETDAEITKQVVDVGRHKCKWCISCFSGEEVLVAHRKNCRQRPAGVTCTGEVVVGEGASASGGKVHQCSECGKVLDTAQHLKTHMLLHTGEKPFACQECGKGFTVKNDLNRHFLTHTGERPHKCEVCGKGFKQKSNLSRHMRAHSGATPYLCGIGGQGFHDSSNLKHHMLDHIYRTSKEWHRCVRACVGISYSSV